MTGVSWQGVDRGAAVTQGLTDLGRFAEPSLYILVSLSEGPKHGYAIMTDVEAISGVPLGPGTLYGALARLEPRGLIEALEPEDRRRPYRLTGLGVDDAAGAARRAGRVRQGRPAAAPGDVPMTRLIGLYPRTWRDRYEDEFLALLAERPPDPLDRLDIVRGAIDARLHPQVKGSPVAPEPPVVRGPWPVRAGWLTLLGGVLWLAAFLVVVNSPMIVDQWGTYRDTARPCPCSSARSCCLGSG